MTGFGKFLVGAAVTSILAWGANAMTSEDTIDEIGGNAKRAFGSLKLGAAGDVTMQRDPPARIAVVSGEYDDAARAKITETLMGAEGVKSVHFAADDDADEAGGDGAAGGGKAAAPAASAEEVADCQTKVNAIMEGQTINFASSSAEIDQSSLELIDTLTASVKGCAGMQIAIGGHTDATGSNATNQPLSQARADAVAAALTKRGVDADNISAKGYGSSQPKVEGRGSAANAANRRIEFTLSAAGAAPVEGE